MTDRQLTVYVTYRLWNEPEFQYNEYVMNCTKSGVEPSIVDVPPLSLLLSVRRM